MLQDVIDDPTEQGDVASGTDWDVHVRQGARAGEPGVDVHDPGAPVLGLHHPLEADGMGFSHVGADDHDAIAVGQVLLEVGGTTPTERGPQTGDRGGVSYAGLVLDLYGTQRGEELLDQIVLLVVQGGAAQAGHTHGPPELATLVVTLLPTLVPRVEQAVGHHAHGGVEVQ